ncbi:hypothetical protein HJC23_001503 [Cyclotella cryptica]|uniref:Excinuclease ABC subunit B n=1 Tax=Cyclotella cryptica TaxID=29204 RepID=A0ABD3NLG5_9STRA
MSPTTRIENCYPGAHTIVIMILGFFFLSHRSALAFSTRTFSSSGISPLKRSCAMNSPRCNSQYTVNTIRFLRGAHRVVSSIQLNLIVEEEIYDDANHAKNKPPFTPPTPASSNKHQPDCSNNNHPPRKLFQVTAPFEPTGDQPQAIRLLTRQLQQGDRFSILRGSTGTGKTLVMSHIIAKHGKPTLVLCHNKTLAAQLARELRSFLGKNAVELFVSYYNHYVPESYNEVTNTYVGKKSSVNQDIDAMRHRATRALLTRQDVVVVASVSCIYGLGLPKDYLEASTTLSVGHLVESPEAFLDQLNSMLYNHEPLDDHFGRGNYQCRYSTNGDSPFNGELFDITLWPPHESFPLKIQLKNENTQWSLHSIQQGHAQGHSEIVSSTYCLFPAKHHVMSEDRLQEACLTIEEECNQQVKELNAQGKSVEASRLQQRVANDLLMLRETGFCSGAENYTRHFSQRKAGEPPDTLIDYLSLNGREWLLLVDESHVSLPQLRAMYAGDRARKQRLIKHGYRLPSALDNRPLKEQEFWENIQQAIFVSATPGKQEYEWSKREAVEMVIRPTFVCDPVIEVRSSTGQLENLLDEIRSRAKRQERTLAVALTKRDAEDLSDYLNQNGVSSAFIHSDLTTHERAESLKALQSGDIDCLVGVNLLREGLDLPQVSLVAVLNADSEGFLRSETALLQTIGRAARNKEGTAIFYADRITKSMQNCIDDTKKRREKQLLYNQENDCSMTSTTGSSTLSLFDLLKDQIAEEQPLEVVGRKNTKVCVAAEPVETISMRPDVSVMVNESPLNVNTDHVPSTPGVYFWKDANDRILYIGKAKRLRSRVKSYLSPSAKHTARIKIMLDKARSIDFILTKSERDALLLESNLIKHHQPSYNVLLKDDCSYPYICASIGEQFPRFFAAPRRIEGVGFNKYRYFGPYPHFKECNQILEAIEAKYDLRSKSFLARHGSSEISPEQYLTLFQKALDENFSASTSNGLAMLRSEFEEASYLFDSSYNNCRDVVVFAKIPGQNGTALVHIVQLREGIVAGQFSYTCTIPSGMSTEEDFAAAMVHVLDRQHYPSGEESLSNQFTFFPNEILIQHLPDPINGASLRNTIRLARKKAKTNGSSKLLIKTVASRGIRRESDRRAMELAMENAKQVAYEKSLGSLQGTPKSFVNGEALEELKNLFKLDKRPKRIECYDISHTQGSYKVGSRVVFIDGRREPSLYRKFNIKNVEGIDDYASLKETLARRFKRAWVNGAGGTVTEDDPWSIPDIVLVDGGLGQLNAAVEALVSQRIFPAEGFSTGISSSRSGENSCAYVVVCALAKNHEELYVFGKKEPINDSVDSPALLLLRSLRDESHRFALMAHRSKRSILKSQ